MFHGENLEKNRVSPKLSESQELNQKKLEENHKLFVPYRPEAGAEKATESAGAALASKIAAIERGEPQQQRLEKNKALFVEYKPVAAAAGKAMESALSGKTLEKVQPAGLTKLERMQLQPICTDFLKEYQENLGKPAEGWLSKMFQKYLPGTSEAEAKSMVAEITDDIRKADARVKADEGSEKLDKAAAAVNAVQAGSYLKSIDKKVATANEDLKKTVLRSSDGGVNMNPSLHGFIAESVLAGSFNVDAAVKKSDLHAEVRRPEGAYGKNSVDIVSKNGEGKIVQKYQVKYGSDAQTTAQMFNKGDYRGQQGLVPEGQSKDINRKTTNRMRSADGKVSSGAYTHSETKQIQKEIQEGKDYKLTYDSLKLDEKALTKELSKQAVGSCLTGVVCGAAREAGSQLVNGEKLDAKKIGKASLENGGDFAAKQTLASGIKVASEKGILKAIPKGTSIDTITAASCVAVEDVKIAIKVGKGELSAAEGVEKAVDTTASTAAGALTAAKGGEIGGVVGAAGGAAISTVLMGNPVIGKEIGTAVGGVVGGTIGYMFGSGAAEKVVQGAKDMLGSLNADEAGSAGQAPQPAMV